MLNLPWTERGRRSIVNIFAQTLFHFLLKLPQNLFSGTKASPPEAKKLPPLIPTYTLYQRRPSLESVPRDQRSPLRSDVESDVGNRGNNKIPSPTSQTSELTSWRCQQCHKTFTQRVALQMHVCPTQPTKPYQCGQCSKTFTNSSDLRAHVISHTTERPFKCGFCSRTFVGATTLNNHVRTHMGQKPFSCEKCGKTFSQAMHLARHARESCDLVNEKSRTDTVTTHTLSTWTTWGFLCATFIKKKFLITNSVERNHS